MTKFGKWQILKELGRGGQGVAHLVLNTEKITPKEKLTDEIMRTIKLISQANPPDVYETAVKKLLDTISTYVSRDASENLGVLKVLHRPDEARDWKNAKKRMAEKLPL